MVALGTDSTTWAADLCSSSRVTISLLLASVIIAVLVRPFTLGGHSRLGRSMIMPYSIHFGLIGLSGLWDFFFFNNLILLYSSQQLYPELSGELPGLHDAVCSAMFSDKPLRPSQNRCIYTEIILHTWTLFANYGTSWGNSLPWILLRGFTLKSWWIHMHTTLIILKSM